MRQVDLRTVSGYEKRAILPNANANVPPARSLRVAAMLPALTSRVASIPGAGRRFEREQPDCVGAAYSIPSAKPIDAPSAAVPPACFRSAENATPECRGRPS